MRTLKEIIDEFEEVIYAKKKLRKKRAFIVQHMKKQNMKCDYLKCIQNIFGYNIRSIRNDIYVKRVPKDINAYEVINKGITLKNKYNALMEELIQNGHKLIKSELDACVVSEVVKLEAPLINNIAGKNVIKIDEAVEYNHEAIIEACGFVNELRKEKKKLEFTYREIYEVLIPSICALHYVDASTLGIRRLITIAEMSRLIGITEYMLRKHSKVNNEVKVVDVDYKEKVVEMLTMYKNKVITTEKRIRKLSSELLDIAHELAVMNDGTVNTFSYDDLGHITDMPRFMIREQLLLFYHLDGRLDRSK